VRILLFFVCALLPGAADDVIVPKPEQAVIVDRDHQEVSAVVFELHNQGKYPLLLCDVTFSRECMSYELTSVEILPGKSVWLYVYMDTSRIADGEARISYDYEVEPSVAPGRKWEGKFADPTKSGMTLAKLDVDRHMEGLLRVKMAFGPLLAAGLPDVRWSSLDSMTRHVPVWFSSQVESVDYVGGPLAERDDAPFAVSGRLVSSGKFVATFTPKHYSPGVYPAIFRAILVGGLSFYFVIYNVVLVD
jgi:hypothetical protein